MLVKPSLGSVVPILAASAHVAEIPDLLSRTQGMSQHIPMSEKQAKLRRKLCEKYKETFNPDLAMDEPRWVIRDLIERGPHKVRPHRSDVRTVGCPRCDANSPEGDGPRETDGW